MTLKTIEKNGVSVAVIESSEVVIKDAGSALDLIATANYETGSERIAIAKSAVAEDFFCLSSGLAGEVLQKFINYHAKLAIYGEFSAYTSKPLHDFIYESNKGKDIFFTGTVEEATEKLSRA